jgi:ParB/RepB/Spo0J family partition protein
MTTDVTKAPTPIEFKLIPLASIIESPWNPRHHFDPVKEANMKASLIAHGQLTIALVRPIAGGKFELAAGHRRFRGAKAAGLATLRCEVREMEDGPFCEILGIENDERDNLHPLDQAESYKLLMEHSGYDVAKIAERIQRSHDFVHDRLRLLQLIPALKADFLAGRFLLAHAILLAKLSDEQQAKAMSTRVAHAGMSRTIGGLYRDQEATLDKGEFPFVPVSPAELQEWINDNCRFEPEAVQLEEDFPETAALLESAQETGVKTVYITDGYQVSQGARDVNVKTIPERSWKRADGEEGSKTCDKAVVGIYADGDRRGEAIGVCVSKTSCTVHWGAEVKARHEREAKREKNPNATAGKPKKAKALKPYTPAQIKAKRTTSIRVAAAKPMEAVLERAHLKPSRQLIAAARTWATKQARVKGSLSAEQLIVAQFAARFGSIEWVLRERIGELKIFGVDQVLKIVKVDTCIYCGCGAENACDLGYNPKTYGRLRCNWISKAPFVCSNPVCVAQHEKAGGKLDAKAKAAVGAAVLDDAAAADDFDDED